MSKPKPLLAFVGALVRRSMAVGSGLLSCCLLVAPPLAAGASAPLSPRDPAIVGGQWTWAGGSNRAAEGHLYGVYGAKGVGASGNVPGARNGSASWTDASGSFWLFGGHGYAEATFGSLNDLWKWDGTSWTWVSGSKAAGQNGVYGTKGVGAPGNVPASRGGSVSWTDASGSFWLFGGSRYLGNGVAAYLNDLWKWDGTNWTWVSGSNASSQANVYGEEGVPAPGNVPGARSNAVSWIDASGNLWLFGGEMIDCYLGDCFGGFFNDLWKWDGTNWAWMGGSQGWGQYGTYGTKGVAAPENVPGCRGLSVSWKDADGSVWLFGGYGAAAAEEGYLNDLWKWDGTNWTWVSGSDAADQPGTYGTKGVPAPANVPGARGESVSWTDPAGNFWLSGGSRFNDLWKWDGTNWTWVSGSESTGQPGTYGTKGVAAPGNVPGARSGSVPWRDASGNLWLFGGVGRTAVGGNSLNDLWKWDGTNWTWVSGSNGDARTATYGTKGVPAPGNVPGARSDSASSRSPGGASWLFGGRAYDGTGWLDQSDYTYEYFSTAYFSLNDLWRWDGTNWTWVSGSDAPNQVGTYGTKGVPAPTNVPGARHGSVSWTDSSGNFWLFGGAGYDWRAQFNDLWKWDGTSWTWMSGSNAPNQSGTYGTKGVPAPENVPGARVDATSWTDGNGNLWLFGGHGWGMGYCNDLWKWDGTNWTWMSGSSTPNLYQEGVYGTKGVPAPENVPGLRFGSLSWTDSSGNFWIFGGSGYTFRSGYGSFNDLWKWDGTNWTWMSGADVVGDPGSYGTKGVAAPTNVPRARAGAVTWTDAAGNLWLFGGAKESWYGGPPSYNDLWKWDGTNWNWVSGSAGESQPGTYGTKGVAAPGNVPGARFEPVSWTDASGNLWLFGGDGFDSVGVSGSLNDLWVFGTTCTAVAPPTAGNLGPFPTGWTIRLTASTVEGATYLWTGPNGFTSAVQNPTIPNATMAKAGDYSVSLIVGGCSSGTSTTTVVVVPGTGQSLSVSKDGAGTGTVSSQPAGIDCGDLCSEGFPGGSQVTLTATADAGSRFAGWVGEGCFGNGPCTLTMDATRHVSASFLPSGGARFFRLVPCRVIDTRNGTSPWNGPALGAGAARAFEMAGRCGVPVDASAVAINVTVTNPTTSGSVTLYPGTGLTPVTDTVFFDTGKTRANNATVGLVGGLLSIASRQETGTVDVLIDVSGYYR